MSRLIDQDHYEEDAGEQQASISDLYQRYVPALLLYLRRHCASIEDAEDLLLEIFAAALTEKRYDRLLSLVKYEFTGVSLICV